jgi:hypothetical protein
LADGVRSGDGEVTITFVRAPASIVVEPSFTG